MERGRKANENSSASGLYIQVSSFCRYPTFHTRDECRKNKLLIFSVLDIFSFLSCNFFLYTYILYIHILSQNKYQY